ncbi:hypothetical protein FXF50_04790 [Micromonospora sp. AP08]|uniref:hypothetical protein n=1 Tax=Micromonospora sp. AP08 TaxID=2604467 RepID=UPI0011DA648E|nr:hypothetical protein [Micromonospora sp. AP08]TYB39699.1 hypothetical protein FXF50_04790 [Micromonospora sp. AP08]
MRIRYIRRQSGAATGAGPEVHAGILSANGSECRGAAFPDQQMYGKAMPIKTFQAQISGDLARVTYTYDVPALNQNKEPWVREDGTWKQDDC